MVSMTDERSTGVASQMATEWLGAATNGEYSMESGQIVYYATSESMAEIASSSIDFFVTSPPYWNLKDYGHRDQIGRESYGSYLERLRAVWSECYRAAKPGAVLAINVGNRRQDKKFYPLAFDIREHIDGWVLWDIVIWYIPNALPQPNHYIERLFDNKFEFVLIFTKDGSTDYKFHKPRVPQKYLLADPRAHKKNKAGRCLGNVIRIPAYRPPNVKDLGYHVAAYPEELVSLLLESYTDKGDRILDPFLGSGTSLKVARAMGRRGIGYEINPEFRDLIEARIQEPFEVPDWRQLDILHSSTMVPGMVGSRKIHLLRGGRKAKETEMFPVREE
jgi:DNA modification methylase